MGCLFAIFAGVFPRLGLFIIWVARPERVDAAFSSWIWPLLDVILWQAGGLSGGDWFWVGVAARVDVGHWGASAAQRRVSTSTA